MRQRLSVQDFEVSVHLGTSVEEQQSLQPVHFRFNIDFEVPLAASLSDHLGDAVDYVELTKIMKFIATSKKYQLVEHLNHQVFTGLVQYLKSKNVKGRAELALKKINVPIENLRNGVVFTCETTL